MKKLVDWKSLTGPKDHSKFRLHWERAMSEKFSLMKLDVLWYLACTGVRRRWMEFVATITSRDNHGNHMLHVWEVVGMKTFNF